MKEVIIVMDDDSVYSKKFVNQAIKLYGKKYLFLSFCNIGNVKEYVKDNKVEALVINDAYVDILDDIKVNSFYILNERNKNIRREGKKTYIYKLQNVRDTLKVIDDNIIKESGDVARINEGLAKLAIFYSPNFVKNKLEIVKKFAKMMLPMKRVLIIDVDELDNYKGSVGFSNIIYDFKENNLTENNIRREIILERDIEYIKSVTYPEDFNVITAIDIATIVNEIRKLDYDYIFINADFSYLKSQYVMNDADITVLMYERDNERVDKFRSYIKTEKQIDYKKMVTLDISRLDKEYLTTFVKENFLSDDEYRC